MRPPLGSGHQKINDTLKRHTSTVVDENRCRQHNDMLTLRDCQLLGTSPQLANKECLKLGEECLCELVRDAHRVRRTPLAVLHATVEG